MLETLQAGELDAIGLARPLCVMPDLCMRLLQNEIQEAPAPERVMTLDRAALDSIMGAPVDDKMFRTMESWSQVAWACMQLLRLGDGKDPDSGMTLLEALGAYDANEKAATAALQRS